jgi:hypothetical protein
MAPWYAIVLALLGLAAWVPALEVRSAEWGFDGTVVRGRVNLLTVVVANPGTAAVEGTLTLSCGGLARQGAPWQASFFLGAGAARAVQFYPLVDDDREFALAWSVDHETFPLREPREAAPALVLLSDPRTVNAAVSRVHLFAEELFPPTVAATDALGAVVLDHAPRWQPAQRQAFHDWIHRGGTVFLLPGQDGAAWGFGGDLAELDRAVSELVCGAGRVVRVASTRREFAPERATALGYAAAAEASSLPEQALMTAVRAIANGVRPHPAWRVIYGVLMLFLLAVGLLPWLLARRGMKARWINLGMVLAIVAATWLLAVVGRRGYGERAMLHSLACARTLGGGQWDVEQLSNLFVTASGTYRIAHGGAPNLYACPGGESIDAVITAAGGGELATSIPLFSSRSFLLRARLAGPSLELSLIDDREPFVPGRLKLRLPAEPPGGLLRACAVVGDDVLPLTWTQVAGGGFELGVSGSAESLVALRQRFGRGRYWGYGNAETAFTEAFDPLVAQAMTGGGDRHRVSVLLFARQPAPFQLAQPGLDQSGRVLYRIDLPLPESAGLPAQPAPATGSADE